MPLSKTLIPFFSPHQTLTATYLGTSLTPENHFPLINRRTAVPSELGGSPGYLKAQLPTHGLFLAALFHSYFWPILGILNNCLKSYTSECDFASFRAPCPHGNQSSLFMQIKGET